MNTFTLVGFLVVSAFVAQVNCISFNVQGQGVYKDLYFQPGAVIDAFWPPHAAYNGYASGAFSFSRGKTTVSTPGVYHIYASLRVYDAVQRFVLKVNDRIVFYAVPTGSGTSSVSGSYRLNKGDQIYLEAVEKVRVWASKEHDNFGAFKIED